MVVCLGDVEGLQWEDFRVDCPTVLFLQLSFLLFGGKLLVLVGIVNCRLVLLRPGLREGFVIFEEVVEEIFVAHHRAVEVNLQGLRMVTEVLVGGVFGGASRVPNAGPVDTMSTPKLGVRAPESAEGEGGRLQIRGAGHDDLLDGVNRGWRYLVRQVGYGQVGWCGQVG
jgi:hypothetical protein